MKRKASEHTPAHKRRRVPVPKNTTTTAADGDATGAHADDATTPAVDPAAQEASVKAYMFHATKLLAKGVKKAKTFETQKLVRKLKAAREPKEGESVDPKLVEGLEAQLVALKALSPDSLPTHILTTRLPKLASLKPFLPTLLSSLPTATAPTPSSDPTSPEMIARNRVLASKAVHENWEEVSRAVRKRMGEEVEERVVKDLPSTTKAKPTAATTSTTITVPTTTSSDIISQATPATLPQAPQSALPEKRLSKRALRAAAGAAKALLPKPGMDPARKAMLARVAAGEADSDGPSDDEDGDDGEGVDLDSDAEEVGSGEEVDWSSGDEDGGFGASAGEEEVDDDDEVARELARLNGGGGSGSDESDDDSDTAAPSSRPPAKKSKPTPSASSKKPATASTFLPSLAGGYISYSDSDGEDSSWLKDAEKEDKKSERKNRRGQRARRAIWEQKYGSGAKHVVASQGGSIAPIKSKKPTTKLGLRKAGIAPPPPADAPFDPSTAKGADRNANAMPVGERKARRKEPTLQAQKVHPSWEAKKRQEEAMLVAKPEGKKVVFGAAGGEVASPTAGVGGPGAGQQQGGRGGGSSGRGGRGGRGGSQHRGGGEAGARRGGFSGRPSFGGAAVAAGAGGGSAAPPAEKMHPSWDAKRKAKEAQMTSVPQGRKITF